MRPLHVRGQNEAAKHPQRTVTPTPPQVETEGEPHTQEGGIQPAAGQAQEAERARPREQHPLREQQSTPDKVDAALDSVYGTHSEPSAKRRPEKDGEHNFDLDDQQ
ncbi:hypothetical protein HNQ50_000841 [Silvimonas terrae]|uniref:Uncharacterized protein n=1 Tax=Silvimonas terrae TaxID=300266 RepID=A0A840RCY1_9NEIS|nr:hypothetical protein [Silvimonas terrae]MBB5190131.1 hypothetical protein [Silvimonas terrae]